MERIIIYRTYGETIIHPIALVLTLSMGLMILIGPRRFAILFFLIPSFFITELQRIVVGGLDFNMVRILLIFAWVRLLIRNEITPIRFNKIDKYIIYYVLSSTVIYTLQWGALSAFISKLGFCYTVFGLHFFFRHVITDFSDIERTIKYLCFVCISISFFMILEKVTSYNIFFIFGGVSEYTLIREGRLRCQGAFTHPILAGTFGATLVPLFIPYLFCKGKLKYVGYAGCLSAIIITFTSGSSGPIISLVAGLVAFALFTLRKYLHSILIAFILGLIFLQLVMKAPIWFLIARTDIIGGSTGYHRAILIDKAIANFHEWWLLGVKTSAHWCWGCQDVTNQFILEGISGGLVTLIIFILMLKSNFMVLSKYIKKNLSNSTTIITWGLGSALFSHIVSFLGVPYFDQIIVSWYLLIAMIASVENGGYLPYTIPRYLVP